MLPIDEAGGPTQTLPDEGAGSHPERYARACQRRLRPHLRDARLDVLLGLDAGELPLDGHEGPPHPLLVVEDLEQLLLVRRGQFQIEGHQVREGPGIVHALDGHHRVGVRIARPVLLCRAAEEQVVVAVRLPIEPRPLDALCRYLVWLGESRPPGWHDQVTSVLGLLLRTFIEGPVPDDCDGLLPPPLADLVTHISNRWADGITRPLSLRELSAAAGLSSSALCRLFRKEFGVGPVTALELIRLNRAEPLLSMSNLTIGSIARQCGFADAYHFSRRFSAIYQMAPSRYRRIGTDAGRGPLAASPLGRLARRLNAVSAAQP
jgi:AraC-like DNA-binding protein